MEQKIAAAPQIEQVTFTEEELGVLVDFFNLVSTKAELKMSLKEVTQLSGLMAAYKRHIDKVEAHILEVKRVTKAKAKG